MNSGMMIRQLVCVLPLLLGACGAISEHQAPARPPLVTDSSQYVVSTEGDLYRATIGYEFKNSTGLTLTRTHCNVPPSPILEKNVGGQWILAYAPVELMCLTTPHFQLAPDSLFRGRLAIVAGKPGSQFGPQFGVESIPGIYRLRWSLRVGPDPESPGAQTIQPISNEFRLVQP
jgi:hypothetical protein